VAADAVSADIAVVEHGALPAKASMAVVANVSTLDMTGIFTVRNNAVVAALAATENRKVIDL
jgi:Flp pilus assembly pilin Flp